MPCEARPLPAVRQGLEIWERRCNEVPRMRKIPEVEYAKALMTEAHEWSLWRWLLEKKKVRQAADDANAALKTAEEKVIAAWNDEMKRAYAGLSADSGRKRKPQPAPVDPEVLQTVKRIKEGLDEAERVRLEAEDIFDEADRRMSTDMARDGTLVAVEAWTLREKAIRKAEAASRKASEA
jgi:hypothetical protein